MFDYIKLTRLLPIMCDPQRMKYASALRLPLNVETYLRNNDIDPLGSITFFSDKGQNIRIFIVYGECKYAMMHDVIDNMHTFCIFADYVLKDENDYIEIFEILDNIVHSIIAYAFPPSMHKHKIKYINDTFLTTINEQLKNVCVYNVWAIFGDKFLEDYKLLYPEESKDIEKIMELYDQIER